MRIFLKKLVLFLFPITILLGIPTFYFFKSGENFLTKSSVYKIIESDDYLIGYLYNESNYQAVKQIAIETNPDFEVMAIGSSRVTQFRSFMFKTSFYNSGYTISTITQFKDYLMAMPEPKLPKVLLLGLDQWMFNEHWNKVDTDSKSVFFDEKANQVNFLPGPEHYVSFWRDLILTKSSQFNSSDLSIQEEKHYLGLNANFYQMGFCSDGSFYYGSRIVGLIQNDPNVKDYDFQDTFERIDKGLFRFEYGHEVNPQALEAFEDLLDFCELRDIKVVAFLAPFAPRVVDKLKNSPNHEYLWQLPDLLTSYEYKNRVEVWDFTDITGLQAGDEEFLDGFHSSEVANLRMLLHTTRNNSLLSDYLDSTKLKKQIEFRRNSLEAAPCFSGC